MASSNIRFTRLGKPRDSTRVLEALPGKLDIKRHLPSILYALVTVVHTANDKQDGTCPGFLISVKVLESSEALKSTLHLSQIEGTLQTWY